MIQVGQEKKAKYWGKYTVSKIARLQQPVECRCEEVGTAFFDPTIVKIHWETPPSDDKNEFWFPYWITIGGKEKYGQFAPMIGEKALLELLENAIEQDFFSKTFLRKLGGLIANKLSKTINMELEEFTKHLHTLRDMISEGVGYFSAWYTMANLNEDEAHALNRYRGFFIPARSSLRDMALLQFAKIFDRDRRTISLRNLLSAAKNNPTILVPHAKEGDLEKLESEINENAQLLNNLKTYRDQHLAHQDKVVKDTSLPYGKVKQLIGEVKDMYYNSLSKWHERSTTSYDFLTREAEQHTSDVKRIMCEERDRAKVRIQEARNRSERKD